MDEPTPRIVEGRDNRPGRTRPARLKGSVGRKFGTGKIARLEKRGESPAPPWPERTGGGERSSPEEGFCPFGGARRFAQSEGESPHGDGPVGTDGVLRHSGGRSALATGR
jgi:hypothetical protein